MHSLILMNHTAIQRTRTPCFSAHPHVRSGVFASLLLSASFLSGCAVVPMRTRTVGWTGVEKQLDLRFIQVSKTSRDEVAEKLAWMDTGVKRPRLFWGRWYRSSRGAAYPIDPGGFPLPMASRIWLVRNVLVEFNESGVVERFGNFSNKELSGEIVRWFRETGEPPLNLTLPLAIQNHWNGGTHNVMLTEDMVQFPLGNGATFSVPRKDILKLELPLPSWTPADSGSAPSDISVVFHFSHERPVDKGCKCAGVKVSPADYLTLLAYVLHATTRR